MAVSFRLRTQKTAGKAPLFVRVQDVNLKVNMMLSTHLDVDMNFYHEYTAYLKGKNYSINSIGKCIKELKTVLGAAESEGYEVSEIQRQ